MKATIIRRDDCGAVTYEVRFGGKTYEMGQEGVEIDRRKLELIRRLVPRQPVWVPVGHSDHVEVLISENKAADIRRLSSTYKFDR